MKAERKTIVWAVLVVEAFLIPALIAFSLLALGCNNDTTIYLTGNGGGGDTESEITGGTIGVGDEDGEADAGDTDGDTDDSDDIDNDEDNDGDGNDGEGEGDGNNGSTDTGHGDGKDDNPAVVPLLISIDEIDNYLAHKRGGNSKDNPIFLNVQIDLGSMYSSSNWGNLLVVLNAHGKYVELDLSACAMGRTDFAPRAITAAAGKDMIVSIILPASATSIATGTSTTSAFSSFNNLTTVTIPESVVSIGAYAFYKRDALKTVIIHAMTPPELGTEVFAKTHATLQIHVPFESVEAYRNAEGWSELAVVSD